MKIIDYVLETPSILTDILANQDEICASFVSYIKDKTIEQVYILGSGTSCHAGIATKLFFEKNIGIRVTPMFPLPFIDQETIISKNSLVIGLSQSGTSLSTILALDKANSLGLYTVAISGIKDSEIEKHAACVVTLACGIEKAVAKTKGYSASLLTLMIMAMQWGRALKNVDEGTFKNYVEIIGQTIKRLPILIQESIDWYARIREELLQAKRIIVLGYNEQYGNILEGALKLVETARFGIYGYEMEEFMHGIYNSINSDSYIIYVGSPGKYLNRAINLKNYLATTTAHQYLISSADVVSSSQDCMLSLVDSEYFAVLEYIVPFQILCHYFPADKGIDPSLPSDPLFHKNMGSKLV